MTLHGGGLPFIVLAIGAAVVIFFVIKSLIKFAIMAGAVAGVVFLVWKFEAWTYVLPFVPWAQVADVAASV